MKSSIDPDDLTMSTKRMVLSIYRRFSESTNFCSKERLIRPVAMITDDARVC